MRWQTETSIPKFPFSIGHDNRVLMLGSCFAENIGERLSNYKFKTCQNPFGIIYNPISLLQNVQTLASDRLYSKTDLKLGNSGFFSFDHHSRFNAASVEETLENVNTQLVEARAILPETKVAFISLGTAFYWWLKEDARVVNNCHKQPAKLFEQKRASVNDVRSALNQTVLLLQNSSPDIEIVFTISPIRHLKHGSTGNQLSKSILMVAAQELAEGMERVHYFPSYELLLDDLRDYRWYEEDLIHPNKMAVDYIWEKFGDAFFDLETKNVLPQINQMQKLLSHRPMQKGGLSGHKAQLKSKAEDLFAKGIDFSSELDTWNSRVII